MWAELSGENFRSLLTWVFAPSLHRSKSYQTALPKDRSSPIWPVCLLFEIIYKLHLSTNDLLEGTRESVWTCACPRLVESGIGAELERNGTISLAFGLKPALRSDYIFRRSALSLLCAHMTWCTHRKQSAAAAFTLVICCNICWEYEFNRWPILT